MKTLQLLLDLITKSERKHFVQLLFMIFIMAIFDMIGVASIMPFMAILANPDLIETNIFLKSIYDMMGFSDKKQFLFVLGIFVFSLLLISLSFKALTVYAQFRFSMIQEYKIGQRLMRVYLYKPYSWFLCRNSSELEKAILSEVSQVIQRSMLPMMTLISQSVVTLALLILLIAVDPVLVMFAFLVFAAAYALIFKFTNRYLKRIGRARLIANEQRFNSLNEAFGGIKELKFGELEELYVTRFSEPAKTYAKHISTAQIIGQLPRFALEAVAFGGMLLVMLFLMAKSGDLSSSLPIISLYALAGYRLMPALQQIYNSITQIRFSDPALKSLHKDLSASEVIAYRKTERTMSFLDKIELRNVKYRYPGSDDLTLNDINLSIPSKSTVALVGATGSGKSTTIDVLLGLLEPEAGQILVDGVPIERQNVRAWKENIGYVPQHIYLADDTITANIAFGCMESEIDQAAVERAAKIAQIHNFIDNELSAGYNTQIGERGVRLSGGQRQRIGIARALYRLPLVLILDEATSAMDNVTEKLVMDAIHDLKSDMSIILIAHRLSTVKACDNIFLIQNGRVEDQGTYEQLKGTSDTFKSMTTNQ